MLPPSPFCAVELNEAGVPVAVNETFITIMGPLFKFAGFAFFEAAADPEGKNLLSASIGRVRDGSPRERVRHVQMITLAGESGLPIKSHFDWFLCPGATGAGVVALHGDPCSDEIIEQREKDRELIDFFQNAPIALHWLSGTGHVLWANQTELDVLGYTREEYIGQPIMKFCPDEEELVLEIFKTLGSGNTIRDVPVRFRTKHGKIVHLLIDSNVAYKVDEEGNKTFNHTRCFIRDDTGRRMREARVNARLKEMELSRKQLDQFMSRTLHLIKTPLHIMQSSNDMAMDELMDLSFSLSPSERESLTHALGRMQTITGQLDEITRLIVDTSDVMRFEHGAEMSLHEERTDLAALGEKCVAEAKAAKQGVEIKLVVAEADRLSAMVDAKILQRSLMHLLRNAVAATPDGGLVTLEIKMSDRVGQRVRFMVSDTGHGLSTNLKHVFERYHAGVLSTDDSSKLSEEDIDSVHEKLASTLSFSSKNTTGLGVGLNLTYGLVRSLGGELCYQSSSTGSQFWFVIPVTICDPLDGSEYTHLNLSSMLSRRESPDPADASFTNMSESDGGTFKKRTPSAEQMCSFAEVIANEGLQAMQAPHGTRRLVLPLFLLVCSLVSRQAQSQTTHTTPHHTTPPALRTTSHHTPHHTTES